MKSRNAFIFLRHEEKSGHFEKIKVHFSCTYVMKQVCLKSINVVTLSDDIHFLADRRCFYNSDNLCGSEHQEL